MKRFVMSEWWRLLLAAAWTGLAIWNIIEGRMGFALLCAVAGMYFAASAPCEHLIRQLEREIDELRGRRMNALATAFLFAPIEDNMDAVGDKSLVTLTRTGDGEREYRVECVHTDLVGADA